METNNSEWYKLWFNNLYPKLYPNRNLEEAESQVDAVIKLVSSKENCLDIACGTGRHLRYLASYFIRSVGLDLSKELIEIGNLEGNFDKSEVYIADMRRPPFSEQFDLITNFFTGFGYFQTDKEHQQMLDSWKSLLKPNGTILIDYLNRDYVIKTLVPITFREVEGYKVEEKRTISADSLRIEKSIVISKTNFEEKYFESVRMYSKKEMIEILDKSGFKTISTYGDFKWNSFSSSAERLIIVAKND